MSRASDRIAQKQMEMNSLKRRVAERKIADAAYYHQRDYAANECASWVISAPVQAQGVRNEALLIDVGALLATLVEDGIPLKRSEVRTLLGRVRAARAALDQAKPVAREQASTEHGQAEHCRLRLCGRNDAHGPECTTYDPNRYPDKWADTGALTATMKAAATLAQEINGVEDSALHERLMQQVRIIAAVMPDGKTAAAPPAAPAPVLTDADIDNHLDAVLRASGSALRHFSMQKTIADMRDAMRTAMLSGDAPAKGA